MIGGPLGPGIVMPWRCSSGEAPPAADKASRFRGNGTIGGPLGPGIVMPWRCSSCQNAARGRYSEAVLRKAQPTVYPFLGLPPGNQPTFRSFCHLRKNFRLPSRRMQIFLAFLAAVP